MKEKLKNNYRNTLKWLIIGLLGVFFGCENDVKEIEKYNLNERFPDQSIKNVEIIYSADAQVAFQLNAPLMNVYGGEKPYREMPEGVHIRIFDSLMNVTTELTSNYAIDLTHLNRMEAEEDVVVTNDKGETLNTEKLIWDKKLKKITSDVFVKITTDNQVLMGDGLIANEDFTNYRILKPRGTLNIEND